MIVISNNIKSKRIFQLPDNVVIRVNMAWVKTEEELAQIIKSNKQDIFLDFPQGRTKPPNPTLELSVAIKMMHKYKHIKYFAISNAESTKIISYLRTAIPQNVELVPKIETINGVFQLENIINEAQTKIVMLDKEDLYLAVNKDNKQFNKYVKQTRKTCKKLKVTVLELQGVIFTGDI